MMVVETNATVDAPKTTWDFQRDDGSPVDILAEFADILCVSLKNAASLVATYPYPDAVPPALRAEAEDELGR